MAVTKNEVLSALRRYWAVIEALVVTQEDVDGNIVIVGTVVSSTAPTQRNVVWIQTQD